MNETKLPFASLGVMGPAGALLVGILNNFVFGAPIVEVGDVVTAANQAQDLINDAALLFGTVTGVIGRWKANKRIQIRD